MLCYALFIYWMLYAKHATLDLAYGSFVSSVIHSAYGSWRPYAGDRDRPMDPVLGPAPARPGLSPALSQAGPERALGLREYVQASIPGEEVPALHLRREGYPLRGWRVAGSACCIQHMLHAAHAASYTLHSTRYPSSPSPPLTPYPSMLPRSHVSTPAPPPSARPAARPSPVSLTPSPP